MAFNFFVPQIGLDVATYGPLSKILFVNYIVDKIDSDSFNLNPNKTNYITTNAYNHIFTLKVLNHRKNSSEFLFDYSIRAVGYLDLKNTIISLIPSLINAFNNGNISNLQPDYPNILRTHTFLYGFSQMSMGYRENINDDFSWGIQGAYLSGISGANISINPSDLQVNSQFINFTSKGIYKISRPFTSDSNFNGFGSVRAYLPSLKNPGLMVSAGFNNKLDDISEFSLNIKDLGFIHWNGAKQYKSTDTISYTGSSPFSFKNQVKKGFNSYYRDAGYSSYNGFLPAFLEGIYSRKFSKNWRTSFILNKNLITAEGNFILVQDVHMDAFHLLVNTGYNTLQNFKLGIHVLYKTPVVEAFIGSENLGPSLNLSNQALGLSAPSASGALNFNFGFAIRLGNCFYYQTATDTRYNHSNTFWQRLFQKRALPYEREKI